MRCFVVSLAAVALVMVVLGDRARSQITGGVNPPGNERRSMGNLRPATPPAVQSPSRSSRLHRPWAYGNPPYYRRPPAQPYYVIPQPYGYQPYYVYPRPYYVYPMPRPYYRYW